MKPYRPIADVAVMALWVCLLTMWTTTLAMAQAAVVARGQPDVLAFDPLVAWICCAISTLSGGTALAWRINDLMLREDARHQVEGGTRRPFVRPWLFAGAHMGGSWLAGILAFLLARAGDMGVWATFGAVLAASFIGAKFIETVAERWLSVVRLPAAKGEA